MTALPEEGHSLARPRAGTGLSRGLEGLLEVAAGWPVLEVSWAERRLPPRQSPCSQRAWGGIPSAQVVPGGDPDAGAGSLMSGTSGTIGTVPWACVAFRSLAFPQPGQRCRGEGRSGSSWAPRSSPLCQEGSGYNESVPRGQVETWHRERRGTHLPPSATPRLCEALPRAPQQGALGPSSRGVCIGPQ